MSDKVSVSALAQYDVVGTKLSDQSLIQHVRLDTGDGITESPVSTANPLPTTVVNDSRIEQLLMAILDKLPPTKCGPNGELNVQSGAYQASYVYAYPYTTLTGSALVTQYEHPLRTATAWAIQAQGISYV